MASQQLTRLGYLKVLKCIHDELRPETYVEIGVGRGASMSQSRPETLKVGIDPYPRGRAPEAPALTLFRIESDRRGRMGFPVLMHLFRALQ